MKIDIEKINIPALNKVVPKNGYLREQEFIEFSGEDNLIKATNGIETLIIKHPSEFDENVLIDFERFKNIISVHKKGIMEFKIGEKIRAKINDSYYTFPFLESKFRFDEIKTDKIISINGLVLKDIIADAKTSYNDEGYVELARALFLVSESNKATFLNTDKIIVCINDTEIPYKGNPVAFNIASLFKVKPLLKDEEVKISAKDIVAIEGSNFKFTTNGLHVKFPPVRELLNDRDYQKVVEIDSNKLLDLIEKVSFLVESRIKVNSDGHKITVSHLDNKASMNLKSKKFDFFINYRRLKSILQRTDKIELFDENNSIMIKENNDWFLSKLRSV